MDAKALAKSKREHTLQHSKKKPSNVQKQGTVSSSGGRNAGTKPILNKHDKERARQAKLPLNWDRYDEEDAELDSVGNSNLSDVVVPKSKGSDYRYLISEAQSKSQSQRLSSTSLDFDCFPSLHGVLDGDFNLGLGSLLSVRGEGIRSWVSDDNFVVEDEKPSTPEASFFSMNLHALAEQLEKVDLSERLFIEPDLLPSVVPDQVSATNKDCDQIGTLDSNETMTTTSTVINQNAEVVSSDFATNAHSDSVLPNEGINRLSQKKKDVIHSGKSSGGGCLHSLKQSYGTSVANNGEKVSSFEATVSEAELDKLLDSFNDSTSLTFASPISTKAVPRHHPADSYISKHVTSNIDDILDGLLNQPFEIKPTSKETRASQSITNTSNVNNVLDDLLNQPLEVKPKETQISQPVTKTSNVNGIVVDLLNQPLIVKPTSKETETSQSATKSKLLDDFDSWLDTI